ncbi:MAG: hypothetical protein LCH52_05345 [Bacteroidetes bacterium]|nr:hypothetical protein [Bacteroidota bacterium]
MKHTVSMVVLIAMFAGILNAQSGIVPVERSGGFARVFSMGGEGGLNYFMVDPINMRYNPAFAKYYSNFLWGSFGYSGASVNDGDGQFGGFNYSLTNKLTVGAILARNDHKGFGISDVSFANRMVTTLNGIGSTSRSAVKLDNNMEILGAYALSDATILGFGVAYSSTQNDFTPASGTAQKASASHIGFGVGIIQHFSKDNAIEGSVDMIFANAKYEGAVVNKVSGTTLGMSARYFHNIGKGFSFVPHVSYYMESGTVDAGGTSTDLTPFSLLTAGLGINYRSGSLLLAGGVSMMYQSMTEKATSTAPELANTDFLFPVWNLGGEFNFTDWMKARIGYQVSTNKVKREFAVTSSTKNEVVQTGFDRTGLTLGMGFKLGNFNLDATVNEEMLRQGLRNLSTGTVNSFGYISASYAF